MRRGRRTSNPFKKHKSGYSLRGFFGQTRHFNSNHEQTGYTVRGFFGGRKRYDMDGNLVSYTLKNFWGGYNTYDADGNLKKRSRKNFFEGYNTYDPDWNKTHESYHNFMEGTTHYEVKKDNKQTRASDNESFWESKSYTKESVNDVKTPNPVAQIKQHIDRTVEYYESIDEVIKTVPVQRYARLLVFSYEDIKEFPAIAYMDNENVKVQPLIIGQASFDFPYAEFTTSQKQTINNLSMEDSDNEFLTFGISKLASEFEDLLPEYSFENGDICRTQYVCSSGLIITEKSMEEIRQKL